ncbi:MAG TPA: DUF2207 domain-containing protein [bacterium]|nr:DUF2207 domain-containing protein [bacterium]
MVKTTARRTILGLLLLLPLLVLAKSYYYPGVTTDIRLQSDGSARVLQGRTYAFEGSFSWADLDLKKQGASDIRLNRLAMQTAAGWQELAPEVSNTSRSLYLRWGYSAQDEERTFLIDYTVGGAVRRYDDVAEFYWKVIEDAHEPIGRIHVRVVLPGPSPSLFKVYVHSAARPGKLSFSPAFDTAYIDQEGIPGNTFVEVRVLSNPNLYPQTTQIPQKKYEQQLAEEKKNFLAATFRSHFFIPLGLLLILLPVALLIVFYSRFGREPKLDYQAIYEHEPPRKAPPLTVPFILHQSPAKSQMTQELFGGLMATLLGLARQGIVSVNEVRQGHKTRYEFHLDKPDKVEGLSEFDKMAAEYLFGVFGGGGNVLTEDMIRDYGRSHPTTISGMLSRLFDSGLDWWHKQLGVEFTEAASRRAYALFGVLAAVFLIPGSWLLVGGLATVAPGLTGARFPFTIAAVVVCGMVYLLAGRVILRWDPTAYLEHKRWQNFKKFLKDFSAIEQAPVNLLAIWEYYYVYAVALGVAEEFLKHVTRLAEQRGTGLALPLWYIGASGMPGGSLASLSDGFAGFGAFASNMSSMMTSFSTASTTGGGFSGGGGGGGGGGSSGAG